MIRVYPVQDDDGHWYIIPHSEVELFYLSTEAIQSVEPESEDWYEELSIFEHRFGKYMTGGDLNLVPLYAEEGDIEK